MVFASAHHLRLLCVGYGFCYVTDFFELLSEPGTGIIIMLRFEPNCIEQSQKIAGDWKSWTKKEEVLHFYVAIFRGKFSVWYACS